jgi:acetolactate synthase-1/2/3 large subunit
VTALRGPGGGLLLGGRALREGALRAAARIRARTGCSVWTETFAARHERGAGLPDFPRLPYFPEQARATLASVDKLVLVGARNPVAFFAYPNQPSRLAPEPCAITTLCGAHDDATGSLEELADALAAPRAVEIAAGSARPRRGRPRRGGPRPHARGPPAGGRHPVDEGRHLRPRPGGACRSPPPHTTLALTGGAIGQGLPCAVGAAVACPGRRVIAFQADGSGLYTLQALWTMAREALDVTVVICANRAYRILQVELARAGIAEPGPAARSLTQLGPPPIDWVAAASAFGVPGTSVRSAEELAQALGRSFAAAGPSLIEAMLPG